MFCPKCGTTNDDQATFCQKCGANLRTATKEAGNQKVAATSTGSKEATSSQPGVATSRIEYAGFWRRLGAGIIDGALMLVAGIILAIIFRHWVGPVRHPSGVAHAIFWLIVPWLYWALLESSSAQGTLGKMALGIIVTDGAGKRISFARATGRHFAKIISGVILLIGFIMIAFTSKKQGLHDIIADCLVVVKKE